MDAAQLAVTAVGAGLIAIVLLFFFNPSRGGKQRGSDSRRADERASVQ